jgi:hypothetical protein
MTMKLLGKVCAKRPKTSTRTMQINNTQCHHSRHEGQEGHLCIKTIGAEDILFDVLTKVVKDERSNHGLVPVLDARGEKFILA